MAELAKVAYERLKATNPELMNTNEAGCAKDLLKCKKTQSAQESGHVSSNVTQLRNQLVEPHFIHKRILKELFRMN